MEPYLLFYQFAESSSITIAAQISYREETGVQTHLKLDVFLYAEAYKNRSFTAFDAREAYWNRRTRRYMYTPSTGRVRNVYFAVTYSFDKYFKEEINHGKHRDCERAHYHRYAHR